MLNRSTGFWFEGILWSRVEPADENITPEQMLAEAHRVVRVWRGATKSARENGKTRHADIFELLLHAAEACITNRGKTSLDPPHPLPHGAELFFFPKGDGIPEVRLGDEIEAGIKADERNNPGPRFTPTGDRVEVGFEEFEMSGYTGHRKAR